MPEAPIAEIFMHRCSQAVGLSPAFRLPRDRVPGKIAVGRPLEPPAAER
jgi:hypothetical protein